jgi:molybdenum cofactor synthesis domain-containing protein
MKRAELITIGDEILNGDILDINSKWICEKLVERGVRVEKITIVQDDLDKISTVVSSALCSDVDYLIVSGGLGPTPDDVTIEAIAKALRREIRFDPEVFAWVEKKMEFISKFGVGVTTDRKKLALKPEGMVPIYNRAGVAPGLIAKTDKTLIVLPGVPRELRCVFDDASIYIDSEDVIACEELKVLGLESDLVHLMEEVEGKFPHVKLGSYPNFGIVRIRFYSTGKDGDKLKSMVKAAKEYFSTMIPVGKIIPGGET